MSVPEVELVDDFDAFWAAKKAKQPHTRIRGVVVPIPLDLPLALIAQMQGATVADEDANRATLAEVYGEDVIEKWIGAGMGAREFFVVLTWSFVRGSGGSITFEEAVTRADEVMAAMAEGGDASGKASKPKPNRKTRRSAGAGASSSRTSAASTASRRKTSKS